MNKDKVIIFKMASKTNWKVKFTDFLFLLTQTVKQELFKNNISTSLVNKRICTEAPDCQ